MRLELTEIKGHDMNDFIISQCNSYEFLIPPPSILELLDSFANYVNEVVIYGQLLLGR